MKKIIYTLLCASSMFITTSCNKWLQVDSSTNIVDEVLFDSGDGYRVALNGIYTLLGETNLYGKELSYGLSTVIAETYVAGDIGSVLGNNPYTYFVNGDTDHEDLRVIYDNVWESAYNAIANCNKLLANIDSEDNSLFDEGEAERRMIKGEAIAVRALLHFEIFRLFGYDIDEAGAANKRLPYIDDFETIQPSYLNSTDFLAKIISDLEDARAELKGSDVDSELAKFDATRGFYTGYAIDIFFGARSSRMNYYATTLLLSRAHLFNNEYNDAYTYAKEVYDYGSDGSGVITFTNFNMDIEQYYKMSDEILFAGIKNDLTESYETAIPSGDNWSLANLDNIFGNDNGDYRKTRLINSNNYSVRWRDNDLSNGTETGGTGAILPVLRISEAMHIMAECMATPGTNSYNLMGALNILDLLRFNRGIDAKLSETLTNPTSEVVLDAIYNDYQRESMDEGRSSWLFKRTGEGFVIMDGPLLLPRSETDYVTN